MPPTAHDAVETSRAWLEGQRGHIPGYRGAFVSGSIARLTEDDSLPAGSDVDVMIVADQDGYLGKTFANDILIEGTVLPSATVFDAEAVLRHYHLAPGIAHARIIDDPEGEIARVQDTVTARYADLDTIRARLDHVEERSRATLASAVEDRPEADKVNAWFFGTGQLAHMILVAALENPTIRKRYVLAAEVLSRHDEDVAYERLLRLGHINRLRRPAVETLMRDLDTLLAQAGPVADGSDWRFASDIATPMRPFVIEGIRSMIDEGHHREAMFPIGMTWLRCAQLLEQEGARPVVPLGRLREALHVTTDADLHEAVREAMDAIPALHSLADRISGSHEEHRTGMSDASPKGP